MNRSDTLRSYVLSALTENLGLKAVALLCALGFFVFIQGAERATRTFSVAVVRTVAPAAMNRQLLTELPNDIAVTISGPRTRIDRISPVELGTIRLELSTGYEGTLEIKPSMFNVPPGLRVEQVFPSTLSLRWDDVVERTLPVQIARTGQPPPGFSVLGQITTMPATVSVRGPKSVVDVLQFVRAAPFDVSGLGEGYHPRSLGLDPAPKHVSFDVESITATVQIVREERVVPFKAVRVEVVGLPLAVTKPSTVSVELRGIPELVERIESDAIVPRVSLPTDVDLKKPGSMMADVIVDLPGLEVSVNPKQVLVKW